MERREGGREEERERKEKITIIYDVAKMLRLNISQGLGGCPERCWRGSRQKREIVIERFVVNSRRDSGVLQDGFDLGRKNEATVLVEEVERLDADAIADEYE